MSMLCNTLGSCQVICYPACSQAAVQLHRSHSLKTKGWTLPWPCGTLDLHFLSAPFPVCCCHRLWGALCLYSKAFGHADGRGIWEYWLIRTCTPCWCRRESYSWTRSLEQTPPLWRTSFTLYLWRGAEGLGRLRGYKACAITICPKDDTWSIRAAT